MRLCAIGDGAPWIWKWVEELFAKARQILDYYHCSRYLHAVAEAQYGADGTRAAHWLEATLARLFCGEATGVVWGLQRMQPVSDEAEEAIGTAVTYLQKRLHQVDFASHRKGGNPIGSGGDRIGPSFHRPCSPEAIRRLVVSGKQQRHPGPALRPVQTVPSIASSSSTKIT